MWKLAPSLATEVISWIRREAEVASPRLCVEIVCTPEKSESLVFQEILACWGSQYLLFHLKEDTVQALLLPEVERLLEGEAIAEGALALVDPSGSGGCSFDFCLVSEDPAEGVELQTAGWGRGEAISESIAARFVESELFRESLSPLKLER